MWFDRFSEYIKKNGFKETHWIKENFGISDTAISMWRQGKNKPSLDHALKIQNITNNEIKVTDIRPELEKVLSNQSGSVI